MPKSSIRFTSYPRTEPPPIFIGEIVETFRNHEAEIASELVSQQLKSDEVLRIVAGDLAEMGFLVETGKASKQIIDRPVFFGENGEPTLRFEVDAYHSGWQCGLEIEAIRGIRGGALYRDIVQALAMVGVKHLCIAIRNVSHWGKSGRSRDYLVACETAQALYGHSRLAMPYGLTLIGY
jgi:hypothetical protein